MSILITSFEPYDDKLNASEQLLQTLANKHPQYWKHIRVHYHTLACETDTINFTLSKLFEDVRPDVCLFMGQAPGRDKIYLERIALNLKDFSQPDNAGKQPRGELIIENAPAAYWATLPNMATTLDQINQSNINAEFSNYAGAYLCNQALYFGLHYAASRNIAMQCGFLHIPLIPEQCHAQRKNTPALPLEIGVSAVEIILEQTTDHNDAI